MLICDALSVLDAGWVLCDIEFEVPLPQLAAVEVDEVQASEALIRIVARTRSDRGAVCPGCGQASDWEHSRYARHIRDEAVGGRPVVIDLSVRRLYCENPHCSKQTFAEQVDGLTRRCGESWRPWPSRWRGLSAPGYCWHSTR